MGFARADLALPFDPQVGVAYEVQVLAATGDEAKHNVASNSVTVTGAEQTLLATPPDMKVAVPSGEVSPGEVAFVGKRTIPVRGGTPAESDANNSSDSRVAIFKSGTNEPLGVSQAAPSSGGWSANVDVPSDGVFRIEAAVVLGDKPGARSAAVEVRVDTSGPGVLSIEPSNLAYALEQRTIKVQFDPLVPIEFQANDFVMTKSDGTAQPVAATIDADTNMVTVQAAAAFPPDTYTFTVKKSVADKSDNTMKADVTRQRFMPVGAELPTVSRGITGPTGPNVEFGEYTKPRDIIDGFNPSDRVETRVSRLYYYRDAHRVAQIINREAKSYNRAAVDMQEQLANKSRQIADQATDDRRTKELKAIEAARKTREAEQELQQAEQDAQRAAVQASNAQQGLNQAREAGDDEEAERMEARVRSFENVAIAARARAESARINV